MARRRALSDDPVSKPPKQEKHEASPFWGGDPLSHLSDKERGEVSSSLKGLLGQSEAELQAMMERLLGFQISTIFEVADKASLGGEFGGLIPLSKEDSLPLIKMWMSKLKNFQQKGLFKGDLPGAFALRMLEDGTLVLKAISVPKGMIFSSDSVESTEAQHPHQDHASRVESWSEEEDNSRGGSSRRSLDDEESTQ